jgi:hypothetical protein
VSTRTRLFEIREVLTPADHQTHRRYPFRVPPDSHELDIWVRYAPKVLGEQQSMALGEAALAQQAARLATCVGQPLAEQWSADYSRRATSPRIANLLTISLDDAVDVYRGAGHRQARDQHLALGPHVASPGLVRGPLPPGAWTLTLSAHTLVSDQCELSIQIEAEIASSR